MDADYSVELGSEDPVLEFPWKSEDGNLQFIDLRAHPERITQVTEAREYPALISVLVKLNAGDSRFQTAKCDVWHDDQLDPAEDIYSATTKVSSYLDVLFADIRCDSISNFGLFEALAKRLTAMLDDEEQPLSAVEVVIRRLYLRDTGETGYYMTVYVSGYGGDRIEAEGNWAVALDRLAGAFAELSSDQHLL